MATKTNPKPGPKLNFKPDDMLQHEFNYIAQTAYQANEDRSRFTSFYLVSTGSLVAAIVGTQLEGESKTVSFAFFILFLVLTIMGALTIAQLARLRTAWYESVTAMNKIKDFYIEYHPRLSDAFLWRTDTIPKPNKRGSIANLTAMEVSLLSALTTGASIYFLLSYLGELTWISWVIVSASTGIGYYILWAVYQSTLNKKG